MKKTTLILSITLFLISFSNYSDAQEELSAPEKEHILFNNSIYFDAGYGYGGITSLWSSHSYSALSVKMGNRWKLIGTDFSTYNLGLQLTWIHYSFNTSRSLVGSPNGYAIGLAGIGVSNMFRIKKNSGFEVNINLIPLAQNDPYFNENFYGPMGNLELRFRYKRFYLGLDSGVSMLFGGGGAVFGAHTGMKLGVNLF